MDAARFLVDHTLDLGPRGAFCALGDILDGAVAPGMVATAGPAEVPWFRQPVHAVELADAHGGRRSWVALVFRCADPAERDRWRRIAWAGATLSIPPAPILHPCPCCGFRTLAEAERGSFGICPVCDREDDLVQHHDPDHRGGATAQSLNEARAAFFAAHPHLRPA